MILDFKISDSLNDANHIILLRTIVIARMVVGEAASRSPQLDAFSTKFNPDAPSTIHLNIFRSQTHQSLHRLVLLAAPGIKDRSVVYVSALHYDPYDV
jgi:hypothetical protein